LGKYIKSLICQLSKLNKKINRNNTLWLQHKGRAILIEVKAEQNLKAKSLKVYHEKYKPSLALRLSMSDFHSKDWLVNVPLYGMDRVKSTIASIHNQ